MKLFVQGYLVVAMRRGGLYFMNVANRSIYFLTDDVPRRRVPTPTESFLFENCDIDDWPVSRN